VVANRSTTAAVSDKKAKPDFNHRKGIAGDHRRNSHKKVE
jgi:hypothetical protein